jgi:hypothetical protein
MKLEATKKNSEEYTTFSKLLIKYNKELNIEEGKYEKVWNYCHINGELRGATHSHCNLKLQITPWKTPVPIVFHNFRGYDSHLICESVGRLC